MNAGTYMLFFVIWLDMNQFIFLTLRIIYLFTMELNIKYYIKKQTII